MTKPARVAFVLLHPEGGDTGSPSPPLSGLPHDQGALGMPA